MSDVLNDKQLLTLLQHGPLLDEVAAPLPQALQDKLLDLQRRAGDVYAAGQWQIEGRGEPYVVMTPGAAHPPTQAEAQRALGEAYLALEEKKKQLKGVMDAMGLNPSAQRSLLGQAVDNVRGWFR